ncbi:ManO-protein [Enterococcus mundtii]|nr:ManO-protein [Enterococcus mundtii]
MLEMVQSLNTKVDLTMNATSYLGVAEYGKIMIGDKGFEFYNDRDARKFVQIPWEEVDVVIASVMFKGKWIPRFAIRTKKNGTYSFSAKHPKEVLRAIRKYVDPSHMVRSLSLIDVVKRGVIGIFKRK